MYLHGRSSYNYFLFQGQTSVHAYFPSDTWYSLQPETYGQKMFSGFNDVNAPLSSLTPVFVRGGFVLPRQSPGTTTTASRLSPFELLITVKTNAASSVRYFSFFFNISTDDTMVHKHLYSYIGSYI